VSRQASFAVRRSGAQWLLDAAMKKLLTIFILGSITAVLALCVPTTVRWGGSCAYPQREYELTFVDSLGNPIEGVELKVEDIRGKEFFCFPVTDYLPGQTTKSDKFGVMQFHHVRTGVEWDEFGWSLFGLFDIHTTKSPVYICRFLRDGMEVYRVAYGKLPHWDCPGRRWEDVPKVTRRWKWSAMIPNQMIFRADDTDESYHSRMTLFFHQEDDNDKPSREGVIAYRNACRLVAKLAGLRASKEEPVEDIEFPVIRRTITVVMPGPGR